MTEQSIFDKFGQIRADLDQIQVAPERQAALDALQAAQLMCETGEKERKAAELALTAAVRKRNDIAAKLPRGNFRDEWRASVTHPDRRG